MTREIKCLCGSWHPVTDVTLAGAEVIACPMAPADMTYLIAWPADYREVSDGQDT